jgi:tetratricopeptide (TPR) repeat protein
MRVNPSAVCAAVMALAAASCRSDGADQNRAAAFTGSPSCERCHASESAAWRASQHAVAMQAATPATVRAPFDSIRVLLDGVAHTFVRRADRYYVIADAADGRPREFPVSYTFGVDPLQQYLVEYTGGRMQALSVAWDTRPAADGGQRWFSLNPGRRVTHEDEEHWTGRLYNWNFRCADCHSTAVRKAYDPVTDRFATTRSEVSVGCEACHGPGSRHLEWARTSAGLRRLLWRDNGLAARLDERRGARWLPGPGATSARRSVPRTSDREIETCAQCHARRIHIADGYVAGAVLTDFYIPSLLEADLYYPDGQQRAEVYNYGSFLQSRMYRAGVTCSDCHDPHTQRLRAPGNLVCGQCHDLATYDTTAHQFHAKGSATCASCHMPQTTYMEVDPRRDHSIRVPRPDLSVALGVPNPCTQCHVGRDARWADASVRAWYGRPARGSQNFAHAFAADLRGDPGAADSLTRVAGDSSESPIARASALARLAGYPDSTTLGVARAWSRHPDVLGRLAALQVMEAFPPAERRAVAIPALRDERRAVRQGAAWLLARDADSLPADAREAFARAAREFVESQRYNADQPDHRLALGHFYAQRGQLDSAAAEYAAATRLAPSFPQAWVELAEVRRVQGRVTEAEAALREGIRHLPREAGMYHALGSFLLTVGRARDAVQPFATAARLRPDVAEFREAHARALDAVRRAGAR